MAPPDGSVSASLGSNVVLGHFPQRTKVVATISGSSTINDGVATYSYGLGGHPGGGGGEISLNSDLEGLSPGNRDGLSELTATIDVQGSVYLGQRAQQIFAGVDGRAWTMTGTATANVKRVEAILGIGVQYRFPYTMADVSSSPGYSLTLLPRSVGGQTLAAADPASWIFVPDDGSAQVPACIRVTRSLCETLPTRSGTVKMVGYANSGPPVEATIHISLPAIPEIVLTLSKDSVGVGDTIFVTATVKNATDVKLVSYAVSVQSSTGTCLIASSPVPGACHIVPQTEGALALTVTAIADGTTISTTRSILVTGCQLLKDTTTITDSLLLKPEVQRFIKGLADSTKWTLPLKDQSERGGFILRRNDTLSFVSYNQPTSIPFGPCLSGYSGAQLARIDSGGYAILAQVHTHPKHARNVQDPGNCYNWDCC